MSHHHDHDNECHDPRQFSTVPSPTPPWARPVMSPMTESLQGDGTISLTVDTTYLDQTAAKDDGSPYAILLPDGNFIRQYKTLFVPKPNETSSALFRVTGTFTGFGTLLMGPTRTAAMLQWDGHGWHWVGGNAELSN
jgi:hypothetical protein